MQRSFEQPLHHETRQSAHDREIRNQRRELRAKLPHAVVRQRRLRRVPALVTAQLVAPIFGDVRLDRGQLGHLVTPRSADLSARVQRLLAMPTDRRDEIDNRLHPFDWHQRPGVPRMPRLSPRFAATLRAATPFALLASEAIGGGWLGRHRRVLLAQRQLPLQICDLFLGVRDPFLGLRQLPPQALILLFQLLDLGRRPAIVRGTVLAQTRSSSLRRCLRRTHPAQRTQLHGNCPAP